MKRGIRARKRKIIGYETIGNEEAFILESIKLNRLRENYEGFIKASGNAATCERFKVSGYNRNIQSKAVWADKKISYNKILSVIVNKNWSDDFKRKAINVYQTFEDDGHVIVAHFIGRFLQRKDQNKFTKIGVEDIFFAIDKGNNYIQDGKKCVLILIKALLLSKMLKIENL